MNLTVYKGFDISFLADLEIAPLVEGSIEGKKNVLLFDNMSSRKLEKALLNLEDDAEAWILYEEYSLIKTAIDNAVDKYGLQLTIFRNNLYPDYYPVEFEMSDELVVEIIHALNDDTNADFSEDCQKFIAFYNALSTVDGVNYGGFYNYEYEQSKNIRIENYYPTNIRIEASKDPSDYNVFLNEDIDTYLRDLARIMESNPGTIGLKSTAGNASNRFQASLQAYCVSKGIRLIESLEMLPEDKEREAELITIARNDIGITDFKGFRNIKFYKNPDIDNEVMELSQGQIIQEILHQAEKSYDDSGNNSFRDIFITASTGAGKSLMFQIPAVYLAKKYGKLTLIIEPVKALMQDQKEKLNRSGYKRVESFNSDLITQVEKEAVLQRVKDGEVDLLYLSPETLLSYSIETIIGDREIGLLIVDEAHIVTTWGVGFRPDYWYLGGYINNLRNQIQTSKGKKRKTYNFPICAFTATAVNGGNDDSVSDTIISLYMENPIKYLGYVRRDDIEFEIVQKEPNTKLPSAVYEKEKTKALDERLVKWLRNKEKTIVYFPYATYVRNAARGLRGFAGLTTDKRIGTYTGRNVEEMNLESFKDSKDQAFDGFRQGTTPIMFATKAFGMGVDVDDVQNVYHYAVTGNLCDYVQEVGRAARKASMQGHAITDTFYNDFSFMKALFGMSQIKQYQIKQVLQGIYDTYKSKGEKSSFLISPESFTYIFSGRGAKNEDDCINKLKTCLLMLEKDFYDKYNFKVIISRPQSVFTRAFVCVFREHANAVLGSQYGDCFSYIQAGRYKELQADGSYFSDAGDIYLIDLKQIWERFHPNISFPQFKYWYFNSNSKSKEKVDIMPGVRPYFAPRQKVNIEARRDLLLCELRESILKDFEYVGDMLYTTFGRQFFTTEEFAKLLRERFGMATARIIANSLFALVDPEGRCVKNRIHESSGKMYYSLAFGNFKEYMRRPITKSQIVANISKLTDASSCSSFLCLDSGDDSVVALKLLSIFNYITYEIAGGEEPEIFIRLNDPSKIKSIVFGTTSYSNSYVSKAKRKHDRDVEILLQFFNGLKTNMERWNFIEDYFLGHDVLCGVKPANIDPVKMIKAIDKEHSYQTNKFSGWKDMKSFFDKNDQVLMDELIALGIGMPEYLETSIKKSDAGNDILMSWPSKEVLICQQDASDKSMELFRIRGWHAYRLHEIDFEKIKKELS